MQSATERTLDIRYEPDEQPPPAVAVGLGAQYALLAVSGIVITPAVVVRAGDGSDAFLAWATFAALAISGVTTILQAVRLWRIGAGRACLRRWSHCATPLAVAWPLRCRTEGRLRPARRSLVMGQHDRIRRGPARATWLATLVSPVRARVSLGEKKSHVGRCPTMSRIKILDSWIPERFRRSGVRRPRRAVRQSLNFISLTTVRRSRSPKICCWMVWLNRLVTFTVVVMAPPCHFTPKLPFTVAYPSV